MFVSVEGEDDLAILQDRFNMDRTFPKLVQVGERVLSVVRLQLNAAVAVLEEQLAAVLVVPILDIDDRPADVRQIKQQPLFHFVEFAAFDFIIARILVESEGKELVAAAEIEGQELVDERQVVVDAADLEDFLTSQACLPIPVALDAEVVALLIFVAES